MASPHSDEQTTYLVEALGVRRPIAIAGGRDERIAAIAATQRGRVSRSQLLAAGIADGTIYRLAAKGHLHRLHRGVYAVGHAAPVPLGPETAALLACGDHAVLSHQTAARLWKLLPAGGGPIHVTIRGRNGARPSGVRLHRTNSLSQSVVRILERLPVTSPLRTLIDIAPGLDARTFERAVEEALIQRLVTERQLATAAGNADGRRGTARLAALLKAQREPANTRSKAEERFRSLIRAAQLPEPKVNVRVHGYELDFYWPGLGVVVEVQGYKFHSGRPAFERDSRKGAKLTAAGLSVSYVTWIQMDDEPYAVVARLAQTLTRAEDRRAA
jgi:very-short-patch-repair endonuclease